MLNSLKIKIIIFSYLEFVPLLLVFNYSKLTEEFDSQHARCYEMKF